MAEVIDSSRYQELAEYDLGNGERRLVFEGEEPHDEAQRGVARIVMLGDGDSHALTKGLLLDSDVDVGIPTADIDSEIVFEVSMVFFVGDRPVVLLRADEPLPRAVALFACEGAKNALEGAELTEPGYQELAKVARNIGRWMLEMRLRRIEQTVRDALNDEIMSSKDYEALRCYADRLALVERLARQLHARSESWRSHEPPGRWPRIGPAIPDRFFERLTEVEAEARSSVTRLSGLISSQQIVLTQRQGEQAERFQRLVTLVGAAVLVPGLVAGSFGANVDFPGRETVAGFWAMLALMTAGAVGSYALLRALESGQWRNRSKGKLLKRLDELSLGAQLAMLACIAGVLATLGIALMVAGDSDGRRTVDERRAGGHAVSDKKDSQVLDTEAANCRSSTVNAQGC